MLEAMSHGCIPIVTDVGDIKDYFLDNSEDF